MDSKILTNLLNVNKSCDLTSKEWDSEYVEYVENYGPALTSKGIKYCAELYLNDNLSIDDKITKIVKEFNVPPSIAIYLYPINVNVNGYKDNVYFNKIKKLYGISDKDIYKIYEIFKKEKSIVEIVRKVLNFTDLSEIEIISIYNFYKYKLSDDGKRYYLSTRYHFIKLSNLFLNFSGRSNIYRKFFLSSDYYNFYYKKFLDLYLSDYDFIKHLYSNLKSGNLFYNSEKYKVNYDGAKVLLNIYRSKLEKKEKINLIKEIFDVNSKIGNDLIPNFIINNKVYITLYSGIKNYLGLSETDFNRVLDILNGEYSFDDKINKISKIVNLDYDIIFNWCLAKNEMLFVNNIILKELNKIKYENLRKLKFCFIDIKKEITLNENISDIESEIKKLKKVKYIGYDSLGIYEYKKLFDFKIKEKYSHNIIYLISKFFNIDENESKKLEPVYVFNIKNDNLSEKISKLYKIDESISNKIIRIIGNKKYGLDNKINSIIKLTKVNYFTVKFWCLRYYKCFLLTNYDIENIIKTIKENELNYKTAIKYVMLYYMVSYNFVKKNLKDTILEHSKGEGGVDYKKLNKLIYVGFDDIKRTDNENNLDEKNDDNNKYETGRNSLFSFLGDKLNGFFNIFAKKNKKSNMGKNKIKETNDINSDEKLNKEKDKENEVNEYEIAKEREFDKNKKYFLITWAQNNTKVHRQFFYNLKKYAEYLNADIHVIAGRYKNPNSLSAYKKIDEKWSKIVSPYLDANRHKLHKNIWIMSDIKIQPTAINPMSGMEALSRNNSCIFGHPKVHFQVIPTINSENPKVILTTGACTIKNYTDSKAGKKGEFNHQLGFCILEIHDEETFYVRQVTADENGDFIDLNKKVYFKGNIIKKKVNDESYYESFFEDDDYEFNGEFVVETIKEVECCVMGDIHCGKEDKKVVNETFNMFKKLKPNTVVLHDIFDGYSISHHDAKDPFIQYSNEFHNKNSLKDELDYMLKFLDKFKKIKNVVIVRSNHDDFLDRWLKNSDWKKQPTPKNYKLYMEMSKILMEQYEKNPNYVKGVIPEIINNKYPNYITLARDDSFKIKGWELGMHGDKGINGARPNVNSFRKLNTRLIVGHSHSPERKDGVIVVGTSTKKKLGYNVGPSSWANAHAIIHPNGKAQLILFFTDLNNKIGFSDIL
jgi:hypothetical protein